MEAAETNPGVPVSADGDGTVSCRFYRAGAVNPTEPADVSPVFKAADENKPAGRPGRATSVFGVATMEDMHRWVLSFSGLKWGDPTPTEIFYKGPEPFVYPVSVWDAEFMRESYWDHGLLLTVFLERREELEMDGLWRVGGHEILIDPAFITSSRRISMKRFSENAPDHVVAALRRWQRDARWR